MKWEQLLSTKRSRESGSGRRTDGNTDLRSEFEKDYHRIIGSASFRRLQDKTQVFPLDKSDFIRTRLTHSMEVSSIARSLGQNIAENILLYKKDEGFKPHMKEDICNILQCAGLIHDIGNPPFGHYGEVAIREWFERNLSKIEFHGRPVDQLLNEQMLADLYHFEGNAQGIRLVHTLMRMNLTWAQVGCILKYTRPAWWMGETPASHSYLMKKPGYYLSEEAYIERLRKELSLTANGRFPLTWIMEAADDISYCVADLEDAVEKRIFSVEELYQHLYDAWGKHEKGSLFAQVVENAWEKSRANTLSRSTEDQFFMYLRVNTLNKLVPYAASRFIDNLPMIFSGEFNHALLEDDSSFSQLLELYKHVAMRHVFSHPDVEQLELQGYRVISGLLEIYRPLLQLSVDEFSELVEQERVRRIPIESRLYQKLSTRHRLAYVEAIGKLDRHSPQWPVLEYYYRCRLIQDYISGMTDLYAWDEYRKLMAVE